ncbi:alpha/beta hydrolase [uncultured Litoreibacter sp.]|uniref:alpha/beta fold hydrolase n=1 Tax=uncultured Litoreibacter sp. TaxID=1392394 RepID=UPI00261BC7F3|nr:alpha/beta hydrolase [uncultured Litoreibacter sp.]
MAHFIRSGHGPEDGLLLHCMLANARALDGLTAKLAGDMQMLSMDLPGHGQSEDWDTARDYAEMARDMAVGLLERPAHIVGHSYGGYVALRLAVDHPELVRSLTLIEPVFFAAAKHSDLAAFKTYERSSRAFIGAIAVGDLVSAARAFTADWGDGKPWESMKPDAMDYIIERMPLVAASGASIVKDSGDVFDRLGEIDVPCLLIEGQNSPPVMGAILTALVGQIANTQRVEVEDAGHMAPLTHVPEVAALISAFQEAQPRSSEIS